MMNSRAILTIGFILLFAIASNGAAGIYKWVDENGHVQYGDRPPVEDDDKSEEVDVQVQDATPNTTNVDRQQARERLLQQYQKEREEKKAAAAKKRKEKKIAQTKCAYAKNTLLEYQEHGVLYERLPNQKRRYLTDAERNAEIAKMSAAVKKWCK